MTSASRKKFNIADSENNIRRLASIVKNEKCQANSTFINEENETAIVHGTVCGINFYGFEKKCREAKVTVIQFGGNSSSFEIDCSRLSKDIGS